MLKSKIREKILKIRKIKSSKNINIKFKIIYDFFKKKSSNIKIVGGYYPVNNEIDDLKILSKLEKKQIKISLPLLKDNFKMDFVECSLKDPFNINKYGIPDTVERLRVA